MSLLERRHDFDGNPIFAALFFRPHSCKVDGAFPGCMRARFLKRSVWILAILFALATAAFFSFRHDALSEKKIEGKPISRWVRDLGTISKTEEAHAVLVKQGPSAIPALLDAIKSTRGISARLETRLTALARKRGKLVGEPVYWELARNNLFRVISDIGLRNQFSPNPAPELDMAVQAFLDELSNRSLSVREQTTMMWWLGQFGRVAKTALPTMAKFIREGNSDPMVLEAVVNIGAREYWRDILPAATNRLAHADPRPAIQFRSRWSAVRALGSLGTNAVSAVPQLIALLQQNSSYQQELTEQLLIALSQIGEVPPTLKPRLSEIMEEGNRVSGAAAAAMLRIDQTEPTALMIVQSRLHPAVKGYAHEAMVDLVCQNPFLRRLMQPQLEKLASRTNAPTALQARFALKEMKAAEQRATRKR
jgi:hypothetical protein